MATDVMRTLDLFSGAGGLTQGFHEAGGYRAVAAVESDPSAAATFAANFGDIVHTGDIAEWLRMEDVPEVEVVVGGPPCQGFSTLGKQDAEDERNGLWREYVETVRRARPRYFVLENVGAFLRSPQFALLRAATAEGGALADYAFDAAVLNAADYGAAQVRRRTIVIGHHRDLPAPGLPEPTHTVRYRTLADVWHGIPSYTARTNLPNRRVEVAGQQVPGRFLTPELHLTRNYSGISLARIRAIPAGGNRMDIPSWLLPDCWRKHTTGSMDVMGRLRTDRPSVTIRTEFWKPEKGRYLHPTEHRAITHFEAARIQGFPDSYRWVGTKTAIGRQIGNAVPIPLGRAIARHLLARQFGRGNPPTSHIRVDLW